MLGACHDFQQQKTILTEYIENRGHKCLHLPKFHCELNPIEQVWCQAKKHTKSYGDYTLPTMRKLIPEALNSVTVDNIRKYFQKTRDYERAYRQGHGGLALETAVKFCKSHRRVPLSEVTNVTPK